MKLASRRIPSLAVSAIALALLHGMQTASASELLYSPEGNRLRRIDLDTTDAPVVLQDILIERASASEHGGGGLPVGKFRDINGIVCPFPDGSGRFIAGEDTGQPNPPAGWGVFSEEGRQIGKLTATYNVPGAEPFGCAFAPDGTLFTTSVGSQNFTNPTGQLIQWFPPFDRFPGPKGAYPATNAPSDNFCKIATDLGTANGIVIDDAGRVYVSASSELSVFRFSPPFPTAPDAAGGCGSVDAQGSPLASAVQKEVFLPPAGVSAFTGLAFAPNGNLYAAEVVTGHIGEYDESGSLVRYVLDPPEALPPIATGTPQGIAVGQDGTIYYADLDLVGTFPNVGPGPNGKVWRIRLDDAGDPLPPEIISEGLSFPDGVAILPGDLEPGLWPTYAGSREKTFWNPRETQITPANVDQLTVKWAFPTDAIITSSPSVALVTVPGEGRIRVVFILSWDETVYAVRFRDGSEVWRFATESRDGVSFPATASVHYDTIDGDERVFIGNGQTFYALDAGTGEEIWRFDAGTGCVVPGACSFSGERNEIESSAIVVDGLVLFGMDVNDVEVGKGGFYALDARDGRLVWFFDLESGRTCHPDVGDDIRRYDGYHTEAELGLPPGFLATRVGCDHPRTPNGCGNVWSSPSYDGKRGYLYFSTSNCDTDSNPATPLPPPPMPDYDEALVVLDLDGNAVWRWRPREIDNDDLAFGAVPNLFTAVLGGEDRDVVGIGNKDGTYYLLDRDGENELTGARWDDANPISLPYWSTNVVPGGAAGGIPATAAVDDESDRIYFGTAPGSFSDVLNPQRPTMHALDATTGSVLWQNTAEVNADATFSPASGIPGIAFTGSVVGGNLRAYDTDTGTRLASIPVGFALAAAPAFVDGLAIVGGGIGTRNGNPNSPSEVTARIPHDLTALCVPGTPACAVDQPVSGHRLRFKDWASHPERRSLRLTTRDPLIVAGPSGSAADPTLHGAQLRLVHPFNGEELLVGLPAAGWVRRGGLPGSKGYLYRDRNRERGPCTRATIRDRRIDVRCKGEELSFTLDEPQQEKLVAALAVGNETTFCMQFGGNVKADTSTANKSGAAFVATDAEAPANCVLP